MRTPPMATAPLEDRLLSLLVRWDELHRQGREVSPEELCAECPELVEELRRRIEVLRNVGSALDTAPTESLSAPQGTGSDGAAHRGTSHALHASATYRPQQHHARGGLGEVLTAHQEELDRLVALKRIRPD